jgi:hypothetical protein
MGEASPGAIHEAPGRARLPVRATLDAVLSTAWSGKWRWLQLTILPLALQVLLALFGIGLGAGDAAMGLHPLEEQGFQLLHLVAALSYVPAVTEWMRHVIAGASPAAPLRYRVSAREAHYVALYVLLTMSGLALLILFLTVFVLATGMNGPGAPLRGGGMLWLLGAAGLVLWFGSSFVLCLPAAANGEDASFRAAATRSAGHRLALLGLGAMVFVVVVGAFLALAVSAFAGVALVWLFIGGGGEASFRDATLRSLAELVGVSGAWIVSLLNATALAIAYRRLGASLRGEGALPG